MTPMQSGLLACLGVMAVAGLAAVALNQSRGHRVLTRSRTVGRFALKPNRLVLPGGVLGLSLVAIYSPRIALIVIPVAIGMWFYLQRSKRNRIDCRYERSIPLALEAVASSMRSGAGLLIALEEAGTDLVGPVADDLRQLTRKVRHGLSVEEALADWSNQRALAGVELTKASLSLAIKTGAAHAEVIDRVAISVRQSLNAADSAKTHAAQAHASAWALTLLPVVVTGPMLVFDPSVRHFLLHTWIGTAVLMAGVGLDLAGAFWMTRLTNRTLR